MVLEKPGDGTSVANPLDKALHSSVFFGGKATASESPSEDVSPTTSTTRQPLPDCDQEVAANHNVFHPRAAMLVRAACAVGARCAKAGSFSSE